MERRRRGLLITAAAAAVALGVIGLVVVRSGDDEPATTSPSSSTTSPPTELLCSPFPVGDGPPGPLTGMPVESEGAARRPALLVKIDNLDPPARPQAGLSRADVVFEEKVEGPISRFAAVFHSTTPEEVGPVRSARSTDILLAAMLGRPLFAYSGANPTFAELVSAAPLVDVGVEARGDAYRRDDERRAPHNLFADGAALWEDAPQTPPPSLWEVRSAGDPPGGGQPVTEVAYDFGGGITSVRWVWDAGSGTFSRWQNGTPHVDADGCHVEVANVVVQLVDYVDSGVDDSAGNPIPEADLLGSGSAWVVADGVAVPATWTRTDEGEATVYTGADGRPLALAPGRTWVALVPAEIEVRLDP